MKMLPVILMIVIFCYSCSPNVVSYVGKTLEPTDQVEVFYDSQNIPVQYEIIGHAVGEGLKIDQIRYELMVRAKSEGANAILITSTHLERYSNGEMAHTIKQIEASFLYYNSSD